MENVKKYGLTVLLVVAGALLAVWIYGSFIVKHDNPTFFNWSLEQLVAEKWQFAELTFDLHDSELDDDYKIKTTYEERWLDEGRITQLVRATK